MQRTIKQRSIPDITFESELPAWLQRVLASRGVCSDKELDLSLQQLIPVSQFTSALTGAKFLLEHIEKQSHIVIVGDYDVDGATSTVIAYEILKACGWKQVSYLVPDRFVYGYGLSPAIVEEVVKLGANVIMTVDNGISSQAGVAAANAANIDVIITDHHLPPEDLPAAECLVNPSLADESFTAESLCGAGVVFYLMSAFIKVLSDRAWFVEKKIEKPRVVDWLDLVALATIADVVPLDLNNRILVKHGLARMQVGRTRPGIKALYQIAKKDISLASSQDLGFTLGPRLNAAGRLDDMTIGVECLLSQDPNSAYELAEVLDVINQERRQIEAQDKEQAMQVIAEMSELEQDDSFSISLYHKDWHQGVVGLVASRLKDRYHKPAVIFAEVDANTLKGSARSIDGFHIKHAFDGIVADYPELIDKYGGHAMAAGLNLSKQNFSQFQQVFEEEVRRYFNAVRPEAVLWSDGELEKDDLTLSSAKLLEQSGPWGNHFPLPLFEGEFELEQQKVVGQKHLKIVLRDAYDQQHQAIAFNQPEIRCNPSAIVHLVYELGVNRYRGYESCQLLVRQIELS